MILVANIGEKSIKMFQFFFSKENILKRAQKPGFIKIVNIELIFALITQKWARHEKSTVAESGPNSSALLFKNDIFRKFLVILKSIHRSEFLSNNISTRFTFSGIVQAFC